MKTESRSPTYPKFIGTILRTTSLAGAVVEFSTNPTLISSRGVNNYVCTSSAHAQTLWSSARTVVFEISFTSLIFLRDS